MPLEFSADVPEEGTRWFSCFKKEAARQNIFLEIFTLKIGDSMSLFQPGKGKATPSSERKE